MKKYTSFVSPLGAVGGFHFRRPYINEKKYEKRVLYESRFI